jgi:hypothetical protein
MRRIKLILAVVAVMAAITVASAVPAMANTDDHVFRNNDGRFFFDNDHNGVVFFNDGIDNDVFPFFNDSNTFDHHGFGGVRNIVEQEAG